MFRAASQEFRLKLGMKTVTLAVVVSFSRDARGKLLVQKEI
jgi:hypothetical protein